jgi:hypothetical protein
MTAIVVVPVHGSPYYVDNVNGTNRVKIHAAGPGERCDGSALNLAPVNWVNHDAFIVFTLACIGLFIRVHRL